MERLQKNLPALIQMPSVAAICTVIFTRMVETTVSTSTNNISGIVRPCPQV